MLFYLVHICIFKAAEDSALPLKCKLIWSMHNEADSFSKLCRVQYARSREMITGIDNAREWSLQWCVFHGTWMVISCGNFEVEQVPRTGLRVSCVSEYFTSCWKWELHHWSRLSIWQVLEKVSLFSSQGKHLLLEIKLAQSHTPLCFQHNVNHLLKGGPLTFSSDAICAPSIPMALAAWQNMHASVSEVKWH